MFTVCRLSPEVTPSAHPCSENCFGLNFTICFKKLKFKKVEMFTVRRLSRSFKIPWTQGPPHPLRQPMPIMQKKFFTEKALFFFVTQELKEPPCTWLHGDIVFDQSADYARSTKAEVSLPTHYLPKLQDSHSKDDG